MIDWRMDAESIFNLTRILKMENHMVEHTGFILTIKWLSLKFGEFRFFKYRQIH